MKVLKLGIVGSGMIAGVIASAVKQVNNIELVAVASRRQESAQAFAQEHGIAQVFPTWQEMLASGQIDSVYIATPTATKETIALAAAEHKKHLLVDKPFASLESLERMVGAAKANNVSFMDATHFTHHHRTQAIRDVMQTQIGKVQAVRSGFFFPFMDRTNIRFDPEKEPTGAVGDMAWYSMRAIAEYLQPSAAIKSVAGDFVRDAQTGAVVRGSGLVSFEDGKSSTFDFGYNAGTCLMDLDILGETGVYRLDDFVLDWHNSFAFDNPEHIVGYIKRQGMQTPSEFEFIATPAEEPQVVHMMRNFAALTEAPDSQANVKAQQLALLTQQLLDAYWHAVS